MVADYRALLLDHYTTGLDAATAIDVTRVLTQWAHITKGTLVATALQPPPEMVAMFDQVVILREGSVIYAGPQVGQHLRFSFRAIHIVLRSSGFNSG